MSNNLNINECALLLCIIGGKAAKDNERIFPSIDQAFEYLADDKKLKGRIRLDIDEVSGENQDVSTETVKQSVQLKLF